MNNTTSRRFQTGDRVRLAGSPGFVGTVQYYFRPLPSGNVNVLVAWDRGRYAGSPTVLETQLEAAV
jgi:hypothetical protein